MKSFISSANSYISKHKKYIDTRISLINDYVTSENSKLFIPQIISDLTANTSKSYYHEKEELASVILDLKKIMTTWDILSEGDLLGYIYQNLQTKEHKKNKGQFFTDNTIVSFIINRSLHYLQKKQIRILDPACGSGQFLITAVKYLCRDQYSDRALKQKIKSLIKELIFGLDIDPVAVSIARYNLSKISGCDCDEINIHCVDFLKRDDLNLCSGFKDHGPFDLITGNPPWGSKMSNEIKRYYHRNYFAARSGINTFTLFIERSFDFIASAGIVSFLIPQAYRVNIFLKTVLFVTSRSGVKDSKGFSLRQFQSLCRKKNLMQRKRVTSQKSTLHQTVETSQQWCLNPVTIFILTLFST